MLLLRLQLLLRSHFFTFVSFVISDLFSILGVASLKFLELLCAFAVVDVAAMIALLVTSWILSAWSDISVSRSSVLVAMMACICDPNHKVRSCWSDTVVPTSVCRWRRNWEDFLFPSSSCSSNCLMRCSWNADSLYISASTWDIYPCWVWIQGNQVLLSKSELRFL